MDISNVAYRNDQLRQERILHDWRQHDLAELLGTTVVTIKRWERGSQQPRSYFRAKLCALFGKSAEELGLLADEHPTTSIQPEEPVMWSIPFPRNPFFTGRNHVLEHLHTVLTHEPIIAALTQSYALHGLGGIGKTQLAIEYAYQYRDEYHAIFWIDAETQASLTASFVLLAALLVLPEKTEENQSKVVAAVLRWFHRHEGWLLIFDNVEDLALVKPFLPASDQGSLLLTTRLQTLGTLAQRVELPPMNMQEGYDFLLARTNGFRQSKGHTHIDLQERAAAQAIITEMAGLPLAIEQAGAYIDATKCSLSDYLSLFQNIQHHLLDRHEPSSDHPLSVNETFTLAFERVKQRNPLAAELLTICAFMAPDAIPEMFFLDGALGPLFTVMAIDPLAFSEAIKVLLSYSLLQRSSTTRTITVHRLVQAVLKGRLTKVEQRAQMQRIMSAMVQIFPTVDEMQVNYLLVGEQLITHAQVCLSEEWSDDETLRITLMSHVAAYLSKRARYSEAEPLFKQVIQIGECAVGMQSPLMAEALHGLANLYQKQSNHTEAESLFKRALCIREQVLGTQHSLFATSLDKLGYCYHLQGKNEQAEPLLRRALHIREQTLGPDHPDVATSLNSLGTFSVEQGKYEQAEHFYQRALSIWEQALGCKHPQVAISSNNLGALYYEQGKYVQAKPYYERALHIWEQALGPEHPDIAFSLTGLGIMYHEQEQYEQAEACYKRALHIWEQALGPEHPHVASPLNNLGLLFVDQGQYEQAEAYYDRALHVREQALGSDHPEVASPLNNLGTLYTKQGKYEQAEACYRHALRIQELAWGADHPDMAAPLDGLANLSRERGQYEQAASLYHRALTLKQQHLSPQHPDIAETLHNLACFHLRQQHTTEALSLYQQALAIREQVHGPQHSKTKETRDALERLLHEKNQKEEIHVFNR